MTHLASMWGRGPEIIWALFSLAIVVLVVLAIAGLVRGGTSRSPSSSSALRILEERYARGEISREEFLERKAVLTGH